MLTANVLLDSEQLLELSRGQQLLEQNSWEQLWSEIGTFSPYAIFFLLDALREKEIAVEHSSLAALLSYCNATPSDFEELGRPTKEEIPLNLGPNIYEMHALAGGSVAILLQPDGLRAFPSEQLLQMQNIQDKRPSQTKPSVLENLKPVLSSSGSYYTVKKDEKIAIFKGAEPKPIYKATVFKRGVSCGFISDTELLVAGPWYEYYNGYWSTTPIKNPDTNIFNIETGEYSRFFSDETSFLPNTVSVADFSRDSRLIAFTEVSTAFGAIQNVQMGRTIVMERESCRRVLETPFDKIETNRPDKVFFCANDQLLGVANSTCIEFWSIENELVVSRVPLRSAQDNCSIVFDSQRDLLAFENNGQLIVMNTKSLSKTAALPGGNTSLAILKDHILARGRYGWTAYSNGTRQKNWEHALQLRRLSVLPLNQMDKAARLRMNQLGRDEGWLSGSQRRWLHSVNALAMIFNGEEIAW